MNNVALTGRMGKDIEIRQAGQAIVGEFTLAVKDRDKTSWVDCIAWNKQAEFISDFLGKGLRLELTGRLQQDTWKDKDGNNRSKLKVVVMSIEPIDWKNNENQDNQENQEEFTTMEYTKNSRVPF